MGRAQQASIVHGDPRGSRRRAAGTAALAAAAAGLLAGCGGGGGGAARSTSAAPIGSAAGTAPTSSTTTTAPPPAPAPGGAPLPVGASLARVGAPAGGLPVLSDLVEFDGRLWLLESVDPLNQFGAQVWTWSPQGGFARVLDDPTSQGYLRGRVIGGRLFVPDADPDGLAPGLVHVFASAAAPPARTVVDGHVHTFDVVEWNGGVWAAGGLDTGQSGLSRYDPLTATWTVESAGPFSRLKYLAVLDGAVLAAKRTTGASGAELVRIDAGLTQQGLSLLPGVEGAAICLETLGADVYATLTSPQGIVHARLAPGGAVTTLTGLAGAVVFDFVRHVDGNVYAVGTDGAARSFVYGSRDGVAFTRLVDVPDLRFGIVGSNADGRPSLASFQGALYLGSSTDGALYRLDP